MNRYLPALALALLFFFVLPLASAGPCPTNPCYEYSGRFAPTYVDYTIHYQKDVDERSVPPREIPTTPSVRYTYGGGPVERPGITDVPFELVSDRNVEPMPVSTPRIDPLRGTVVVEPVDVGTTPGANTGHHENPLPPILVERIDGEVFVDSVGGGSTPPVTVGGQRIQGSPSVAFYGVSYYVRFGGGNIDEPDVPGPVRVCVGGCNDPRDIDASADADYRLVLP